MKTKYLVFFVLFIVVFNSCKKQEQPRLKFWPFKVTFIMKKSAKSYEKILDHIGKGRKTIDQYIWGEDTLVLNGPAGYTPLTQKASKEWKMDVNNELMPDTTKLTTDGVIAKELKSFLDLRQDHSAGKAYKKMRLAIPKKLYKTYPHFWERLLTFFKDYYTGTVGGSSDYTDGVRDIQKEKEICNLITASDPDESWDCSCSALLHYESIFLSYAEGDNKKFIPSPSIEEEQAREAKVRYEADVAKHGVALGTLEDYTTKYSEEGDEGGPSEGYYYLELDLTE